MTFRSSKVSVPAGAFGVVVGGAVGFLLNGVVLALLGDPLEWSAYLSPVLLPLPIAGMVVGHRKGLKRTRRLPVWLTVVLAPPLWAAALVAPFAVSWVLMQPLTQTLKSLPIPPGADERAASASILYADRVVSRYETPTAFDDLEAFYDDRLTRADWMRVDCDGSGASFCYDNAVSGRHLEVTADSCVDRSGEDEVVAISAYDDKRCGEAMRLVELALS